MMSFRAGPEAHFKMADPLAPNTLHHWDLPTATKDRKRRSSNGPHRPSAPERRDVLQSSKRFKTFVPTTRKTATDLPSLRLPKQPLRQGERHRSSPTLTKTKTAFKLPNMQEGTQSHSTQTSSCAASSAKMEEPIISTLNSPLSQLSATRELCKDGVVVIVYSHDKNEMSTFTFFNFPAEIRNVIYVYGLEYPSK